MRAVVLAAGASRRARGCKALFELDGGERYVERTLATLRAAGAEEIVVVIALPWRDAIAARLATQARVRTVESLVPERGMLGSLRVGLAAVAPSDAPLVVALVDHPSVAVATVEGLVGAVRMHGPDAIARPRFGGRHGHPVVLGASAVRALREDAPTRDETLRDALARAGRLVSIEVADRAVLEDRDLPPEATAAMPTP